MNHEEVRRMIPLPEINKLKQVALGIEIDRLFGRRILVETIEPYTYADELQAKGLVYIPKDVKKENTPLPSTGIVMAVGDKIEADNPIQPGAMVMFSKHCGVDFVFREDKSKFDETKKWRILDIDEVMCTLRSTNDEPLAAKVMPVIDKDADDVPVAAGAALIG